MIQLTPILLIIQRYNINVFSDQLNDFQRELLESVSLQNIPLTDSIAKELLEIFALATKNDVDKKHESENNATLLKIR